MNLLSTCCMVLCRSLVIRSYPQDQIMSWINLISNWTHPFVVAMLLLTSAWAIYVVVDKIRLRLDPSREHHPVPALHFHFQDRRLTQSPPIAHSSKPSQQPSDTKDAITQPETPTSPIAIPQPANTHNQIHNNSTQLPVTVLPWRASFSLSPRETPTDTSSANGRKGSFCQLSFKRKETETEAGGQRSPESELAGIGGQFTVKLQEQGRQLSFS
ncbi:hypothetical protein B0T14DRAFT_69658 [Immersiella caudata]|uniref:Uncharacterized protein n=1 Tax=Immersiella caudata TaxID=314043 RepID=A0AA39XGA3_9PEZI|nr:hypothetical protein B0T14DRAFT_69658 [Immersiella caudata]